MSMDAESVNAKLRSVYADWKMTLDDASASLPVTDLGPPFLICASSEYCQSTCKILVFGQEASWEWEKHQVGREFKCLSDFLLCEDSIDILCRAYGERALEDIRTQDNQGYFFRGGYYPVQLWNRMAAVLWANISMVSYKKRSFLNCPKTQQGFFLKAQGSVIRKELEILQPDVCIFLTGPNYDPIALECFPHVSFERLPPEIPTRQLATVTNLKVPAYRTYHPRYLLMGRKSHYLDIIRHEIFGK